MAYPRETLEINHYGTTEWFHPLTEWTFCTGMDTVQTAFRMLNRNLVTGKVAYQYAAVRTDEPEAWTTFSGGYGDSDWHFDEVNLSATNDDYFWIRFGVYSDNASVAGGQAHIELIPSFERIGTFHGVQRVQIRESESSKTF